jgi:hypothetical protein
VGGYFVPMLNWTFQAANYHSDAGVCLFVYVCLFGVLFSYFICCLCVSYFIIYFFICLLVYLFICLLSLFFTSENIALLTGLEVYTNYSFSIQAVNRIGASPSSPAAYNVTGAWSKK